MKYEHHKMAALSSFITLGLAFLLLFTACFWMLYPYKTAEVHKTELITKTVKQGGILVIANTYTKWTTKEAEVFRTFENGLMYGIPTVVTNLPTGTNRVYREILIPAALPPGHYKVHTVLCFHVNPLRTVKVEYYTPEFTVVKAKN